MASQTLILHNPLVFISPSLRTPTTFSYLPSPPKHFNLSKSIPLALSFSNFKPHNVQTPLRKSKTIFASSSLTIPTKPETPTLSPLTGSTRTITTLLALTLSVSKIFAQKIGQFITLPTIQNSLACSGPLFFAALKNRPSGSLNTPLTVVAAGMAKWLDIYSGVLLVRVLLSWFPNIPWEKQPLCAIRDLCDPYLNLFRNIIPPIFDTLDVSPLLAFAVLGMLASILNSSSRG